MLHPKAKREREREILVNVRNPKNKGCSFFCRTSLPLARVLNVLISINVIKHLLSIALSTSAVH